MIHSLLSLFPLPLLESLVDQPLTDKYLTGQGGVLNRRLDKSWEITYCQFLFCLDGTNSLTHFMLKLLFMSWVLKWHIEIMHVWSSSISGISWCLGSMSGGAAVSLYCLHVLLLNSRGQCDLSYILHGWLFVHQTGAVFSCFKGGVVWGGILHCTVCLHGEHNIGQDYVDLSIHGFTLLTTLIHSYSTSQLCLAKPTLHV